MMLQFYKMTGAENDFVLVDNRDLSLSDVLTRENIADLCNRRFGVGADGLIAVEPSQSGADVCMRQYNADGAPAELNSSAAFCFTAFVDYLMEGDLQEISIETTAGMLKGKVNADDSVTIHPASPQMLAGESSTGAALIVFRGEVIICEA